MFDWLFGKKKKINTFEPETQSNLPKHITKPKEKEEHRVNFYDLNPNTYDVHPKRIYTPRNDDSYKEEEFSSNSHKWKKK